MTGTLTPEDHAAESRDDTTPSCGCGRRSPSILGLSIVSGLNVVSLAFLAYHFAGHSGEMTAPPVEQPAANDLLVATPLSPMPDPIEPATNTASGNVGLAPSSKRIISIASGFDIEDEERKGEPMTPIAAVDAGVQPNRLGMSSGHWVQLGALSEETTARRYWSELKRRHAALLSNLEPHYFGPEDVGGSLYHIRLGPMTGDAADDLCAALVADNGDCFSINPGASTGKHGLEGGST